MQSVLQQSIFQLIILLTAGSERGRSIHLKQPPATRQAGYKTFPSEFALVGKLANVVCFKGTGWNRSRIWKIFHRELHTTVNINVMNSLNTSSLTYYTFNVLTKFIIYHVWTIQFKKLNTRYAPQNVQKNDNNYDNLTVYLFTFHSIRNGLRD